MSIYWQRIFCEKKIQDDIYFCRIRPNSVYIQWASKKNGGFAIYLACSDYWDERDNL